MKILLWNTSYLIDPFTNLSVLAIKWHLKAPQNIVNEKAKLGVYL
jgi:hypothetical protein